MSLLQKTLRKVGPLDETAMALARARQDILTKPQGSLGRLEALSVQIAGITGRPLPRLRRRLIITMAADHGVVSEGVSVFPKEVTQQMVLNFLRGGAGINVLARHARAKLLVVDMGVEAPLAPRPDFLVRRIRPGSANLAQGPAMTRDEALHAIEAGIEVVEEQARRGLDLLGTGDMGIGNTTPSSAIVAVLTGQPVSMVTGRGTGIDDAQWQRKVRAIEEGIARNQPDPHDAIDVLAKVGGLEIGGLSGVILGAAARRVPVVLDGFISGAAALLATTLCPQARAYLIASHRSVEMGHQVVLQHLGLEPLLDLRLRLGEGTGAALGMFLVEAAAKILTDMATFSEAGVAEASS